MDITLNEYLKLSEDLHSFIDKVGISLNYSQIEEKIQILQISIKNIQSVARKMSDVSNYINNLFNTKKTIFPIKQLKPINYIDPSPNEYTYGTIKSIYTDKHKCKKITDEISLQVKTVKNINDIPASNLYFIEDLQQFAINIEGIIIKGNLGNIVPYQEENTTRCEYGTMCKNFINNKKCKYYHEPEDYLSLNLPISTEVRNFTNGSFMHCNNKKYKNYYTRHVGSRNTLDFDIKSLQNTQYKEEIFNRSGQLIHDLLIYLALNNKGMLENYKQWPKLEKINNVVKLITE